MTRTFNAFEVFEIAEQIERNGARFYRRAAEIFDDPDVSAMFLEMADWETGHEAIFAAMREQLRGEDGLERGFNLEDAPLDPKAMAGLAAFGINPDPATELTGTETRAHVLKMAIGKEKDSVVYYTGLKEFVPAQGDKDKIDGIIKEEMRHIRILNQSLEQCE